MHRHAHALQIILQKNFFRRTKAYSNLRLFPCLLQSRRKPYQRWQTYAPAYQQGRHAASFHIKTVAQSGQHIQRCAGLHTGHGFCALTYHLVDKAKMGCIPLADRNRPPQIESGQLKLRKLSRTGNAAVFPRQSHAPHPGRQCPIFLNGKLHQPSPPYTSVSPRRVNRQAA